jgi:hypothetical protein
VLRLKLPSAPSKNSTLFEYQTNATSAQETLGLFFLVFYSSDDYPLFHHNSKKIRFVDQLSELWTVESLKAVAYGL